MTVDLSQDDRGKTLVHRNDRVATVTDVRSGTAYLDLDDGNVSDELRAALDWDDEATVDEDAITDDRNGQLHLRDDLIP